MRRGVIAGVGMTLIVAVVALLVAIIGHEWVRYQDPKIEGSLLLWAAAVVFLMAQPVVKTLFGRPRRKVK